MVVIGAVVVAVVVVVVTVVVDKVGVVVLGRAERKCVIKFTWL